jgi:hypothetical protein
MAYLSYIFPVSIFAENEEELSCEESRIIGEEAAEEKHRSGGFGVAGVVSGIVLPFLGPLIMISIAAGTNPQFSYVLNKDTINEICYLDGYSNVARKKNRNSAFFGGLIGTGITTTIIITILGYDIIESF